MSTGHERPVALVIGSAGGIGRALHAALAARTDFSEVTGLHRQSSPALDLLDESSIAAASTTLAERWTHEGCTLRQVIVATGFLHDLNPGGHGWRPERSYREFDPAHLLHSYAVNAVGPALLAKHVLPLMPRQGRTVFAALSARIGSIGDNRAGGWYGYRAAKAALNQFLHTLAIEWRRQNPESICVALHPGTTDTALSAPFSKQGLEVRPPEVAAGQLLSVIDGLRPQDSGGFFDYEGQPLPW